MYSLTTEKALHTFTLPNLEEVMLH